MMWRSRRARPLSHHLPNIIKIPGGTFRMGSDKHYPEEAPVHRATVDTFWIDPTPVTNRQFKRFARTTGYVFPHENLCDDDRARGRCAESLLHSVKSARRRRAGQLRRPPAEDQDPAQGAQGRLASVRAELLPPLPVGRASCAAGRYVDEPCRTSLCPERKAEFMSGSSLK